MDIDECEVKMECETSENEEDDSDVRLRIIEDSPKTSGKVAEEEIVEGIDQDLEMSLEEKAVKNKLSTMHVKNIIKEVVTNEQVLTMLRKAENPKEAGPLDYELKLTRAKVKELYPMQTTCPQPKVELSETQVLISEELPEEDSSGDEYIPAEDESEDDHESSIASESDPPSVGPPTPQSIDCSTQTFWTEDGMFKVPQSKAKEEEANIALRTRSKLSLSNTPLEVIEEAFIPPDITTDMYDMDCDDDDWRNFLKQFSRPIDEVKEDEDHDPEYNVLADEEIDKVDKEELRADKGVKISRKELNELIAELVDYTDNFGSTTNVLALPDREQEPVEQEPQLEIQQETAPLAAPEPVITITILQEYTVIQDDQKALLAQQMRQHVQILTQNFLLSYEHPEYYEMANTFNNYLVELKNLGKNQENSAYVTCNLDPALDFIAKWKEKFEINDEEVREYRDHINRVICEQLQDKMKGGNNYVPTFPKYFLSTVSQSPVFLYPGLLPRIPLRPSKFFPKLPFYTNSENELLALGLEQFIPFLKADPNHVSKLTGNVKLKDVCYYITKYISPCKDSFKLFKYICYQKNARDPNPIKYYFENSTVKPIVHYVFSLDKYLVLPPAQRGVNELPYQWKLFLYPELNPERNVTVTPNRIIPDTITKVAKPPVYNKSCTKRRRPATKYEKISKSATRISRADSLREKFALSRNLITSTPTQETHEVQEDLNTEQNSLHTTIVKKFVIPDELRQLKFNSSIFGDRTQSVQSTVMDLSSGVFSDISGSKNTTTECARSAISSSTINEADTSNPSPSMPTLMTPIKSSTEEAISFRPMKVKQEEAEEIKPADGSENGEHKDDLDEINALMVASSTIKQLTKRRLTCAEKKKNRQRRELLANLRMLSAESEESIAEKNDRFVYAFYEKVREQLELSDYHQFMEILNDFDEKRHTSDQLYKKVEELLNHKHPDLLEEFLTFFTRSQANNMGKLVPHLKLSNMSLFLRKLELFFKDQPSQVKKIYRALTDMSTANDITMSQVKSGILPLLKGNALLTDWFLQIFASEKPPDRLYRGGPENIEIGKEGTVSQEEAYESIVIPEIEDPYGGPNCICSCHSVDDITFKTRLRHCIPCGTKFSQGRVFVQTGRGLRLGQVSFDDTSVDHVSRLSCRTKMKRSETSPTKQISPSKDSQDETKLSSDEEPDKKRRLKATRKRKPRTKPNDVAANGTKKTPRPSKKNKKSENSPKKGGSSSQVVENTDNVVSEVKATTDEPTEWDCNTSMESVEVKCSPDHVSAESESEFCEETSQDNNTDTEGSEGESEATSPEVQWTRDEDRTILEVFQSEENKEAAFQKVAELLEHRTIRQIKQRFELLINLLKEMCKNSRV